MKSAVRVLYNFTDTTQGVDKEEVLRIFGISKDFKPQEIMDLLLENKYLNPSDSGDLYFISDDGLKLIKAI
ncbi:MAG: hypothetical protein V3U21_06240 [Thermodesulfobacteriota bacterium]